VKPEDHNDDVTSGTYHSLDSLFSRGRIKEIDGMKVQVVTDEFWTSRQRQACSLHEISYRACFKPQLPRFFINIMKGKVGMVFDPFMGRGTTMIESALNRVTSIGIDINPLSEILVSPRLNIPKKDEIFRRLRQIDLSENITADMDLSMFYHRKTEKELVNLRDYLISRREDGKEDAVDRWIRMVATNRLTGHSSGFFSVYTLPPNQAVTQKEQKRINHRTGKVPEYRNVKEIIMKKTVSLLRDFKDTAQIELINQTGVSSRLMTGDSRQASRLIGEESIDMTITSPPFLNVVDYAKDNWLRCWFNALDVRSRQSRIFTTANIEKWNFFIREVMKQIFAVTKNNGYVIFEVGEVRNGKTNLDEHVLRDGINEGFKPLGIMVNVQNFTKTSNIWGVRNHTKGTNTNRLVVFRKLR